MSNFRNKIVKEAVLPTIANDKVSYYSAIVTEGGEGDCKVSFFKNTKQQIVKVTEAKDNNNNSPKRKYETGELITIREKANSKGYEITGIASDDEKNTEAKYKTYQDIYTDCYEDTEPGYIW